MAGLATHPVKRCLGNVAMHVTRVRNRHHMTYCVLRWKIENFLMLKDAVRYKWQVERLNWILKLDKKRYSVTVTIESESKYEAITGFVCYESLKFSEPVTFEKVSGGLYKAEFGPKIVNHKDNEILKKEGRLELCFTFEVKWDFESGPHTCYGRRCPADEKILSSEIAKSLFRSQSSTKIHLTDFEILVHGGKSYVHKAILQTRSPFLKVYIDEYCTDGKRESILINNTTPEAVAVVLTYIYTGKPRMPTNVDLRIRIFKLAHFFRLVRLWRVYLQLLLRDINETNVVRIKDAGMSTGTPSLIDAADAYFSEHGSLISEEDGRSTATSEHGSVISIQ